MATRKKIENEAIIPVNTKKGIKSATIVLGLENILGLDNS